MSWIWEFGGLFEVSEVNFCKFEVFSWRFWVWFGSFGEFGFYFGLFSEFGVLILVFLGPKRVQNYQMGSSNQGP